MTEHRNFNGMDLHQPFIYGVDSKLPATPSRGDAYFAYDTQRLYVCSSQGVWSFASFSSKSGESFKVDANGIISMPKQSSVKVYLTSSFAVSSAISTIIEWDTVDWDTQNEYSLVTHSFVPKKDGKYLSICNAHLALTAGDYVYLDLYVNGTIKQYSRHDFDSGNIQGNKNISVQDLKAGDILYMKYINNQNSDTIYGHANGRYSSWSIHKLM